MVVPEPALDGGANVETVEEVQHHARKEQRIAQV